MPWWVVGSQVDSSTTIGFQPSSHSKPDGVMRVEGQLLVVGVLADRERHLEAEILDPLVGRSVMSLSSATWTLQVLDPGPNGVDGQPIHRGDRRRCGGVR